MNSNLIIYPTDFSDCAKNALAYVIAMGKVLNCNIKIVHSLEIVPEESSIRLLEEMRVLEEKVEKKLVKLKEEIQAFDLECNYDIIHGSTLFIKDYMENFEPLMIVMGTIGKNGLNNKIFGSLTSKVIRNTKSIVLAVPEKATLNRLSEIIFASDFHIKDKTNIDFMRKITRYYKSKLRVIHMCEDINNLEQKRSSFLKLKNEISKTNSSETLHFEMICNDDTEDELLEYIQKVKPDMIGLVTRKRNFIEHLFDKSLSKKMVNHTNTPVLVFS